MGVGRNHHFDAALLAHAEIDVLQVKPVGIGVALHGHAVFRASLQHLFHVVVEGIAPQQQAPSGVANDLGVGIFDRREHPLRHGRTVEGEIGVDGANYHVELRQDFIRIIKGAILEDVDFSACQNANSQAFFA